LLLMMLVVLSLYAPLTCMASNNNPFPTPPRGFNSWNSFKQWVSAPRLLEQADIMQKSGMRALNWTYIVADGGWYYDPLCGTDVGCEKIDEYGRLVPDPQRYPDGWKGLCDQLHSKGFKCGFHLFRGVPGRAWEERSPIEGSNYTVRDAGISPTITKGHGAFYEINMSHPAAQQYLDSMFKLYCSWGIDFIKLDGMGSSGLPTAQGFGKGRMEPENGGVPVTKGYRQAISKSCAQDVVLSLSAGGYGIPGWQNSSQHDHVTDDFVESVRDTIQMTRVTPDTWDIWDDGPEDTSCPLASLWQAQFGPNKGGAPRFQNVSGHSGCCWGGRISQHFVEFKAYAHIADKYGVFPDGDMLQIGRVGSYNDLKPETLAKYNSPPFAPNNCTIEQLSGTFNAGNSPNGDTDGNSAPYDPAVCPRQSYLSYEEQKTLVSLWAIARSPLIMGGSLPESPPEVIALLTNAAVMHMNSYSQNSSEVYRNESDGRCAWASTPTGAGDNARYVGLFNLGKESQVVRVTNGELGLGNMTECRVFDMWAGKEITGETQSGVSALVPRHGSALFHLTECEKGILSGI